MCPPGTREPILGCRIPTGIEIGNRGLGVVLAVDEQHPAGGFVEPALLFQRHRGKYAGQLVDGVDAEDGAASRIVVHQITLLGIGSACIRGGQGIASLVERM